MSAKSQGAWTAATPAREAAAHWRLSRHPRSARRARAALRQQLTAWGVADEPAETAELLLSELVTNAYRHANAPGREIGVRFALQGSRLRLEVSDASSDQPKPNQAADDEDQGRGLFLVAALSAEWGVCPRPHGIGKVVWVDIELEPEADRKGGAC